MKGLSDKIHKIYECKLVYESKKYVVSTGLIVRI